MALIDQLADRTTTHVVDLMRHESVLRNEVWSMLERLRVDLATRIAAFDPASGKSASANLSRLKDLAKDVDKLIGHSYDIIKQRNKASLVDVSRVELIWASKALNETIDVDLAEPLHLSLQQLRTLVDRQIVLGAPVGEWWDRQAVGTRDRFIDQMRMGILSGETNDDLIRRVRGRFTGRYRTIVDAAGKTARKPVFEGGVLATSTREAETLVRTSVQSVANSVRMRTFLENSDLVDGVQILVTLDNRTSDICRARSGMAWDLKGKPIPGTGAEGDFPGPPPYHHNCRSTIIPVLKKLSEVVGMPGLNSAQKRKLNAAFGDSTQSSMDGQVSGKLNYEAWLKTKPEAFQKDVLGPGRWELWQKGNLTFPQMLDMSGRPLTLEELRRRVGDPTTAGSEPPPVEPTKSRADQVYDDIMATDFDDQLAGIGRRRLQLAEELEALERQARAAHRSSSELPGFDEKVHEFRSLLAAAKALATEKRRALHELLSLPASAQSTKPFIIDGITPRFKKVAAEAEEFIRRVVREDRTPSVIAQVRYLDRPYYVNGVIHVKATERTEHVIHEIMHDVEHSHRWVSDRTKAFLRQRAGGEKTKRLKDLLPTHNYPASEVVYEDKWAALNGDHYMGKVYPGSPATELITMGMERLFKDAREFAANDPEYFKFLINLLQDESP